MMEQAHILLVEDELFLAQVVADSLEQQGYQVTHTADGQQALKLYGSHHFSLCIVDVMLPGIDGFTLVEQIRQVNTVIPILFVTARAATKDLIEGYRSGGNDYLKKPFSLEELFLRIQKLLKRSYAATVGLADSVFIGRYTFIAHQQSLQLPNQSIIRLSHRETQLLQLLYV